MARAMGRPLSTDTEIEQALVAEIATMLDTAGTESILDIAYYANQSLDLSFFYDMKTGHVFQDALNNTAQWNPGQNGGGLFAVFSNKRENDLVYLFFTKDGYPAFYVVARDQGSDWVDIRGGLIFVGSVVLSAVGLPIATGVGNAVLGAELAASYPALAQGIGQAVINTLMNGGDIEKGAISAVASYAGTGVGGQVLSATSSDALASATAAATRAYINGGDLQGAVAQSLIRSGVSNMSDLLFSDVSDPSDVNYDAGTFDANFQSTPTGVQPMSGSYYTDEYGITYGVDSEGDLIVLDGVDSSGVGYYTDTQGDIQVADTPTIANLNQTDSNGTTIYSAQPNPSGANILTSLATTALALVGSYIKAGAPPVRVGTPAATVNANGTVTTRQPNGSISVTRPAAGTPYITATGAIITNNGDGTYTTVSPNGVISTMPYSNSSNLTGGLGANGPLYIGMAVLAAVVLSRR